MRIELTVRGPHGDRDIAITAASPIPFAALAPAVLAAAGAVVDDATRTDTNQDDTTLAWSGQQPLRPTTRLGDPELRTGRRLTLDGPDRSASSAGVLSLHVVGGPDAGGVRTLRRGRLRIGRGRECDLVLHDDRVSRSHAEIEVGSAVTVRDLGSTNGTRVDADAVGPAATIVRTGQLIAVGDSLLEVRGPAGTPVAAICRDAVVHVNRAPREVEAPGSTSIVLPARADTRRPQRTQWITALLPAVAGAAIAWLTHSPQFLLFALLSPLMVLSGAMGDRLHWRRSRRREARRFLLRRAEADAEIAAALADETAARRRDAPDPAGLWRTATGHGSRLWERRRTDDDQLMLRVGRGDVPSAVLVEDGPERRPAGRLTAVPACVDLRAGPVGLSGPADAVAGLARWLMAQLATLHSPADVELALLLSSPQSVHWRWARWLPHVGARVAVGKQEWPMLLESITAATEQRRTAAGPGTGRWCGSWIVLVLDPAAAVADLAGLEYLLRTGTSVGLTALCIAPHPRDLPSSCTQLVQVTGDTGAGAVVRRGNALVDVVSDQVSAAWAEELARELAPLADAADASSALPRGCGLLDVLGVSGGGATAVDQGEILARWASSDGRPVTVLGRSAAGPLVVDLLTQGPHALVAGTTGAGKSELLRSLVLGLAIAHPPEQLTFLLIDYKGGAAFAACSTLPHTAGLVTDLDPHLARRALRSLEAELRRRESLLAGIGAGDLEAYRRSGATPALARLIIVVDEFAALADEVPDFIGGVVSVAQRGRSLGLHLVLATQRPGTAVTPELRANTSLRIALRVTDPGESVQVIDVPDAARIDRSVPGRAYLCSGSELISFQTASAHEHSESAATPVVETLREWRRPAPTAPQSPDVDVLTRTVAALASAARATGRQPAHGPWLPPLPRRLELASLPMPAGAGSIAIGRLDLPAAQAQPAFVLDAALGGGVLVAGRAGSGRTTALVTMAHAAARRLRPDQLEVYVIDATGPLVEAIGSLPHVATALGPAAVAMTSTLLARLHSTLAGRTARDGPLLMVLIDSWDTLLAGHDDLDAAQCAEGLDALLRLGAGTGLTVAVTGGRAVLAPRVAAGFGTRLLLDLHDRADYGLAGVPARAVPDALPPGRGVRAGDGVEFQLAVTTADVDDRIREQWAGRPPRSTAIRLCPLPEHVRQGELERVPGRIRLGLAGDAADPVHLDVFTGGRRILVAGPPRSGRTTLLRALLLDALSLDAAVVVAAPGRSPLAAEATRLGVPVLGPGGPTIAQPRADRTLVLVDDGETFLDTGAGEQLCAWASADGPLSVVVAGRCDDLATTYRGIGAQVRRSRCGILLRPGPLDGELLGVRLPRRLTGGPPGRGVVIGEPGWGAPFESGEPVAIQVAEP